MNRLLNIYIYSLIVTYTLILYPFFLLSFIVICLFLPKRLFYRFLRRFISWYGLFIIKVLVFPFIKVKFVDLAPNEKITPCVFIMNHKSASDPYLLACLPYEIVQVVNSWPFKIPILGFVAKQAGYLSVKEMSYREFETAIVKLLSENACIGAFPEGTRSGEGEMGQFHGAVFRAAAKAKVPIVPLCVMGNERIPTKKFVLHRGTIKIRKLKALYPEQYINMTSFQLKNHIRNIIYDELLKMKNEVN